MDIAKNELFKNHFPYTQFHPEEGTYFFNRIYIMLTKVYYEYYNPSYLCISTQITVYLLLPNMLTVYAYFHQVQIF